jgi:hypothetical protein
LLFKDVVAVALPTSIDNIVVLDGEEEDPRKSLFVTTGRKQFIVRGDNVDGYVIAGTVLHAEGNASHTDPSPLMPKFPP